MTMTDRFPNTFHFSGTLLPFCVNKIYITNVTGYLSYLKVLHYSFIRCLSFLHIMTDIRSFLRKYHSTVIPPT